MTTGPQSALPPSSLHGVLSSFCDELERAAELLAMAEKGMPPGEEVAQVWYLRGLMRAMVAAAQDLVLLVRHDRYQNVLLLCRVGFESRINAGGGNPG
jgi:hypothetical protein